MNTADNRNVSASICAIYGAWADGVLPFKADIDTLVAAATAAASGEDKDHEREAVRNLAIERDAARRELAKARKWIAAAPHGENCFVSNAYKGDPGNQCNCGKASFPDCLCPECGSADSVNVHHAGDFAVPECYYQRCMTCDHQWGHE